MLFCIVMSAATSIPILFLLVIAWSEFIPAMQAAWLSWLVLLILTLFSIFFLARTVRQRLIVMLANIVITLFPIALIMGLFHV